VAKPIGILLAIPQVLTDRTVTLNERL